MLLYSIIQSLVAFPLTYKHVTLNGYFTLNFILHRYVCSSEAWLLELGYS